VSDTVLRAFERWHKDQPGTNSRAWLFTILYRTFVSRRRRTRGRETSFAERDGASALDDVVGEADTESRSYDSFLDDEIIQAIDDLPHDYRVVVTLSDLEELRYAEIADVLSTPEGTVKSRLFRGRRLTVVPQAASRSHQLSSALSSRAVSRCLRPISTRRHVAPAAASVLRSVEEHTGAATVGAAAHASELTEDHRVSG
jgi:RNA polymerase sigma factor (sigma-70 family)